MDNTSYSTAGFRNKSILEALDSIQKSGYPSVEIGCGSHIDQPLKNEELNNFNKELKSRNLKARSIHAPSGLTTLGATTEEWRIKEANTLASFIIFASDIGASDMVIHPIPNPIFVPDADNPNNPSIMEKAVARSLDYLIPIAEKYGIRMNLENFPYHCNYPYRSMKELRLLVEQYPADQLGLILDTGHVGVMGDEIVEEIKSAGDRLKGTHLHDVNGNQDGDDHKGPNRGILNWDDMLKTLKEIQYSGPYTFETIVTQENETEEELAIFTRTFAKTWLSI